MKRQKVVGIVLAGGLSQRLFPVRTPKPLLKVRNTTLLEQALRRLKGFNVNIVANLKIAREIRRHFRLKGLKTPSFIIEPESRDTAAAIGFALRRFRNFKGCLVILSADQWIANDRMFSSFLNFALKEIERCPDCLFVAGSPANSKAPETHSQFGWIVPNGGFGRQRSRPVLTFVEKPSKKRLAQIRSQGALINVGMFFGRIETFLKAYGKHYPDVLNKHLKYSRLKRLPVDKAIFECFRDVRVLPFPLRWEDLGTWDDWKSFSSKGKDVRLDTRDVYVHVDTNLRVYCFGMKDTAIVQEGERLLVMPLSKTRQLKNYLKRIKV